MNNVAPPATAGNTAGSGQPADDSEVGTAASSTGAAASQSPTAGGRAPLQGDSSFGDATQFPVGQTADLQQQASEFRALLAGLAPGPQEATPSPRGATGPLADSQAVLLGALARGSSRMRMLREDADASAALPAAPTPATADAAAAAGAAAEADGSLAELFERHVRRALLAVGSDPSSGEEIRIELSDAVLPGTALSLRRATGGWQLLVSGDNRQSLERIARHGPSLVKRFASASLGSLEILTASGG